MTSASHILTSDFGEMAVEINKDGRDFLSGVYMYMTFVLFAVSIHSYLKNFVTYLDVMNCFCCQFSFCAMIFPVTVDINHSFQNMED